MALLLGGKKMVVQGVKMILRAAERMQKRIIMIEIFKGLDSQIRPNQKGIIDKGLGRNMVSN